MFMSGQQAENSIYDVIRRNIKKYRKEKARISPLRNWQRPLVCLMISLGRSKARKLAITSLSKHSIKYLLL